MTRALAAAAGLLFLLAVAAEPAVAAPRSLDGCVRPRPGIQLVRFGAAGQRVPAAILGRGRTGVVLSNESDLGLCAWLPLARTLASHGFRVLLYDYTAVAPPQLAAGASRALLASGARRVVLAGASEGAKASILAAAATPRVVGVVALSPERFLGGTDVLPAARALAVPALFVVSENDPYAAQDTPALEAAAGSPRKRLVVVPGAAHGVGLVRGRVDATVGAAVLSFLTPWGPPRRVRSFADECGGFGLAEVPAPLAFAAADGVLLHGFTLGAGETAVVLAHEYPSDLCGWFPYASELARDGFRVVLFDARAAGVRLDLDVAAAADQARALGSTNVVAMGASLGGAATLLAAGRDCLFLSGVVSLSGEPDLRRFGGGVPPLDVWPFAGRIVAPLLLVGSRDDPLVSGAQLQRLLARVGSRTRRALVVNGTAHGWDLVEGGRANDAVQAAVLDALRGAAAPVATGC